MTGIPVLRRYEYCRPAELGAAGVRRVPVVVVGGGPVGLTVALDLARRGQPVIVLNKLDFLAGGSKAICWSKRSLDIFDSLGVGAQIAAQGVQWNIGKVFVGDDPKPCYTFDLQPLKAQRNPAFINLQQYHVEAHLIDALAGYEGAEIRWGHEVVGARKLTDGARLQIRTRDGEYALDAEYVLACDGNKSTLRRLLGLDFSGRAFEENFLIADIKMPALDARPAERWFWFAPPFPGHSALLHKQADGVWRCDFQLGRDVDKAAAVRPQNVAPCVKGMLSRGLGEAVDFDFEWLSIYSFQCRRMARFVHDRFIFLGDSAHLVSPFGARGGNGGIADAANLGWKLDSVLRGRAGAELLESYNFEAVCMADENILQSTRTSDFISPPDAVSTAFRDAVLQLAHDVEFARGWVNSGRLSTAVAVADSPLNADSDDFDGGVAPGYACPDAPLAGADGEGWLLSKLGAGWTLLVFAGDDAAAADVAATAKHSATADGLAADYSLLAVLPAGYGGEVRGCANVVDSQGLIAERFAAAAGDVYLIRPDQYVAGRWHCLRY